MAIVQKMRNFFEYWYYQYILWTALYMLESWERKVFNSILVGFVATASYTTYLFLPGHLAMLSRFYHHLVGDTFVPDPQAPVADISFAS